MKTTRLLLAAAFATAGFAAHADDADASQYVHGFTGAQSRAAVQSELVQARQSGVNPWSTSYDPLKNFRSGKTRAQVTAEFLASRDRVSAFTGEDSGSGYLAQGRTRTVTRVAGQPSAQ